MQSSIPNAQRLRKDITQYPIKKKNHESTSGTMDKGRKKGRIEKVGRKSQEGPKMGAQLRDEKNSYDLFADRLEEIEKPDIHGGLRENPEGRKKKRSNQDGKRGRTHPL